ncbi:MAG TPA: LLM class flavin-dependent oxidoreductase [Acidimicrobiales bacterium]|jgi:alkanesulfonate monooxygenase SsuD/methylene tetrahydromethanopterin reductase-like flavin-dependent oxidoreductase (luciferase family)
MRTAVSLPPFTDPATLVAMAVDAEQAGWDGVFLWDHVVLFPEMNLDVHNPWVVLGAMAQATERVLLGTLVTPLARRRPQSVAREIITLDHLSGGRAVLGVGLGDPAEHEFAAFGDPAGDRDRAAILDESLTVIDGLLRGPLKHDGEHFHVDSELRPRPVQQPRPPIWVAGVIPNRRPLERALRWDGIVPISLTEQLPPEGIAPYLEGVERPEGWDVVVNRSPGYAPEDYEGIATWVVEGAWPVDDWVSDLRDRIKAGPGTRA